MKAFALDELGQPGSIRELPVPKPAEGQVGIRIHAAGLNPFDSAVVNGRMKGRMEHRFPLVPGMDASGTVEAIGDGVTEWSAGDDVFGSVGKMYLGEGTLAEFTTMSAATIARKPLSIEHADAASVPVAGITALIMADAVSIAEGDVVVVIGATGGVGSYLVQISASRGANVVAVCSTDNVAYARKLGAADVIDYTSVDVVDAVAARYPDGINAVADMRGDTDALGRLAEKIRKGGHVASAVGSADVEALARRDIGATNVQGIVTTASLQTFVGLLERKNVIMPELHSFPLAEGGDALTMVGSGHVRGKLVVVPL
jgi:NADPH2:quinone reductase